MDQSFADILKSCSSGNTVSSPGVKVEVVIPPLVAASTGRTISAENTPANTSAILERFQSVSSKMMATANMSVEQEVMRICNLPIIKDPTPEEIKLVTDHYVFNQSAPFNKGLFPEQVKAMMEYHDHGNILCPIKVGGGKALVSVLVSNDAYTLFGKRKILLMNPSNLVNQLRDTELPMYRKHISINVPFYWLSKENKHKRMLLAQSNRAGVYVVSYALLSRGEGAELMDAIKPDIIIGDEIHRIASARTSARNRRFKEIVKKYSPDLVSLSGTLTKKSLKDYHFIAKSTLQENCFMPRPTMVSEAWSEIIDSNASGIDEYNTNNMPQPGPIMRLVKWARKNFPEEQFEENLAGFRKAFKFRMKTCPGVIASDGEGAVPLRISNIKLTKQETEGRPGWDKLQELLKTLLEDYVAPNGDEIDHAMHIWRWRYEMEGFGFYNNLFWPDPAKISQHKSISLDAAQDILDRSIEHHLLKQEYHKVLRQWIKYHAKTGMDTPFLLGGEMSRNGSIVVGGELYDAWCKQREAKFEGILERERAVVRVCDFRVNKIVEWAKAWYKKHPNKTAIVWYKNKGVGLWLRDAFMEADLPVAYCPSGDRGRQLIDDRTQGNKFAIAAASFREGRNLQFHHDTEFFAQWFRESDWIEQAMGRIDRAGQESDQARYFTCINSQFDKMLLASTLNDATYAHQTGSSQKLLYADWDERPQIVPSATLMEWSGGKFAPQMLDVESQKMLIEKFHGE